MQAWNRPDEAFVSPVEVFEPSQVSHVNEGLPDLPLVLSEAARGEFLDGLVGHEAPELCGHGFVPPVISLTSAR